MCTAVEWRGRWAGSGFGKYNTESQTRAAKGSRLLQRRSTCLSMEEGHVTSWWSDILSVKLTLTYRIIDDRIEKSIKGKRIGHCVFAASLFIVQSLRQY